MGLTVREIQLAEQMKSSIDKQEINQRQMAEAIHITPQLLSHIRNGRRTANLRNVISIGDYLEDAEFDLNAASALFGTPKPLNRPRRDKHPLSKMVGQDREEMERIEAEKRYDIWDVLGISQEEILPEELQNIISWLYEFADEIESELAVFVTVCDRYGLDMRKIVSDAKHRRSDV